MNKFTFLISIGLICASLSSFAQDILISQGGTVNVSGGEVFYDAGGAGGNDGNANHTITLCPTNPNEKVALDFTFFLTYWQSGAFGDDEDPLFIYNGTSTAAQNIGELKGDYSRSFNTSSAPYGMGVESTGSFPAILRPTIFSSTDASGCLTLEFVNGTSDQSIGWVADVITYTPLDTPGCAATITTSNNNICPGESVTLTAGGNVVSLPINSDFNSSTIGTGWSATSSASYISSVCSGSTSLDNSIFLWMQNAPAPRALESNNFDVSNGGTLSFEYRQADSDNTPCETSDAFSSSIIEGIYVQYSTDNGSTWSTFKYIYTNATAQNVFSLTGCGDYVYDWTKMTYPIPSAAQTSSTKFRWVQAVASSANTDNWGLDNVIIATPLASTLTVDDNFGNNTVPSTSNSSSTVTVSPNVTTTYTVTITDGITTCTEDVTITVNSGAVTTINYGANTYTTSDANQNITVTNGPVTGSYTSTPSGLTIDGTTGMITPSTSSTGTYTISVPTSCGTTDTTVTISAVPCGTCTTPTCPIAGPFNDLSTASNITNHCSMQVSLTPTIENPDVYESFYTVQTSATGTMIGLVVATGSNQVAPFTGTCTATRNAELFPSPNTCVAAGIAPTSVGGTFYNPEWTGLTPNTTYIIKVITSITAGCEIVDQCASFYRDTPSSCSTCATATCPAVSIIETTAALGQTNITTTLATAGDQLGLTALSPGESVTVCVPVTVPVGSTVLGFKQRSQSSPGGCASPAEEIITYELLPASNCAATPIAPNLTNASGVGSGFNPEWNSLASGDYVLCYTMSVANFALCSSVQVEGLGYYNVIPVAATCQDYQIQMYTDLGLNTTTSQTSFNCSDSIVYLGPDNFGPTFDAGIPYPAVNIVLTAITGNLNNLNLLRYDAVTNNLAETLPVPASGSTNNFLIRPAPGQYYILDKTNAASGTYNYTITDVISGTVLDTGTWTIVAGAPSVQSINIIPNGISNYSGPGVVNGLLPNLPIEDYSNDGGLGYFDPSAAGVGNHTITYTWDNGLTGSSNCSLTRTLNVTVTGPSAPTVSNISICTGTTATLSASGGTAYNWYDAATMGTLLSNANPFITPNLTTATSYWVSHTSGGCESPRTQVDVTITAGTNPTYISTIDDCEVGSISLASVSPTGTTLDWISGPTGYAFPAGYETPQTTNTDLTNLPAGTYCVDISSPNTTGGVTTSTLLTEDFESGTGNWTINNSSSENIFVVNNVYLGGTCTVGPGLQFTVPDVPNQGAWSTGGTQSNYLHIMATSTCDPFITCAEGGAFPPANANYCSTAVDQNITLNTPLNTTGQTNITFDFYYINNPSDPDDYGALEYSINGGVNWIQAGANLIGHTTWFNESITNPAWDNQASLLFRIRWRNDGGSSTDPPLALDQITITGDMASVASCGATIQECFTINPILSPVISCGTSTTSSTQFNWTAVTGATSYTVSYQIGANPIVTIGDIGNTLTYTASSTVPNPINPGDNVEITVTPVGASSSCFDLSTFTCTAANCIPPTLTLSSVVNTDSQVVCINTAITDITYDFIAGTSGATGVLLSTGSFPTGITGSFASGVFTISGTPSTTTGSPFNYTLITTGGCSNPTISGTITVNPQVTPSFTQVADICSGDTLAALPLVSNNGINGSWLPALDNTATTLYTFTPDTGECATTQTMTITVNAQVTPSFTQVADICSGDTLAALPLVSNNGINGSWLPALDNTATTLYTFTPDTGECATTQTMTITVNGQVTPLFTQVADICSGDTLAALPLVSNDGINGTWLPALDNTATTLYTFTPDTGECATTQTMTITVNAQVTPLFTQVADICSGDTLGALPLVSNNGINGTWLPALDNTATTLYTFTPDTGECATTQTMTITVNAQVTPLFTQVADICSGDTLAALPLVSNNGINGSWLPALDNTATTLYTFTPDTGECATTQTMTITVNAQVTPLFTQVADICSGDTLGALPLVSNNGINGTWLPALDNTATTLYTFTPDTGECATTQTMTITVNAQVTPSFTQVADICSGDTLAALSLVSNNGINGTWLPVLDNTATTLYTFTPDTGECATTQTMTITVNAQVTPLFTQVADICSGDTLAALSLVSNNGINGTWLPALDNTATTLYTFTPDTGECATTQTMTITVNAQVTPLFTQVADICSGDTLGALPLVSNNGINGSWLPALDNTATTLYTFTPDTGECATTQTMTITVNAQVTPSFTQVADICSGDTLVALPLVSNNGINGTWLPALDNTATTLYTFTPDTGECATTQTMTITVNAQVTPSFTQVADICSGDTLAALPLVSNNGINGTWLPALDNTATTLYTFTPDTGECATTQTMTITVNAQVTPSFTQVADICSGDTLAALPLVSNNGINGTWLPALDNIATTLYTFTPDTGECATTQTMTITVNAQVTPSFTQVADICSGDTLAALPLVSNNGINGTWLPALDNTATTLYTFTPDTGECATTQTMTITVNAQVTPSFTQVADICSGDTLAALPLVSNNGINGTWLPALDNTATTLYTFTPDTGECATTQTMTITVNTQVTPSFTQVADICSGDTLAALPLVSNNGVNGSWLPALDNTATTLYTFTPDTGECATTQTMTITVISFASVNTPMQLVSCDSDNDHVSSFNLNDATSGITTDPTLDVTYHLTQENAEGGVLALVEPELSTYENNIDLTQAPDNLSYSQIIWVRVDYLVPTLNCSRVLPLELLVNETPDILANPPMDYELCDDDSDGFVEFNLPTRNVEILNGLTAADYQVTYYTDVADAEIGVTATSYIASPASFTNTVIDGQVLGVRVEDISGNNPDCYRSTTLEIIVNPLPVIAGRDLLLALCDNTAPMNDSMADFDLTEMDNQITGSDASLTVDYYENPADVLSNTPIADYTVYTGTANQTLQVVVTAMNGCTDRTTLTLRVLSNPSPTTAIPNTVLCDDAVADGITLFDLTDNGNGAGSQETFIINGELPRPTLTYHLEETDAELGINSIPDPTMHENTASPNSQLIYVRVTNGNVDTFGENCYTIVSFTIVVEPLPNVSGLDVADIKLIGCELDGDDLYAFDLTQNTTVLEDWLTSNGQIPSDYYISYHNTSGDAIAGISEIINTTTYINEFPGMPGVSENPQTIYVRITNGVDALGTGGTGCYLDTVSFELEVQDGAISNQSLADYVICDNIGTVNDGIAQFNLSSTANGDIYDYNVGHTLHADILNSNPLYVQDPLDFGISFYSTAEGAEFGPGHSDQLPTTYENTTSPDQQIIYVRVDNDTTTNDVCYDVSTLRLMVNPLPVLDLEESYLLCTAINGSEVVTTPPTIDTGLDVANYSFVWSLEGTPQAQFNDMSSIEPTQGGTYTVLVTDRSTGCDNSISSVDSYTTIVNESSPPLVSASVVTAAFATNHGIEVSAENQSTTNVISEYEFSLNDGEWQLGTGTIGGTYTHTFLDDVRLGENNIKVRDINGCGMSEINITVLDYPLYFTPNGDGIHETWNIVGFENQAGTRIYIFDRFGKLLKQLNPSGAGWDGTYNGEAMPTNDYWFTVDYIEPSTGDTKQFKAHFTLKR